MGRGTGNQLANSKIKSLLFGPRTSGEGPSELQGVVRKKQVQEIISRIPEKENLPEWASKHREKFAEIIAPLVEDKMFEIAKQEWEEDGYYDEYPDDPPDYQNLTMEATVVGSSVEIALICNGPEPLAKSAFNHYVLTDFLDNEETADRVLVEIAHQASLAVIEGKSAKLATS